MPRPRTKILKLFSFLLLSFPLNLLAQEEVEIIGITPFQIIISIAGIIAILMLLVNIVQYLSNGSTSVKAHKKERMALIGLFLAALASWFVLFTTDPDIVAKISFQIDKITSEDSPIPLSFLFKKDKTTNHNTEGSSSGGGTRTLQCSDGKDNDGDGLIDYPNDPGCLSAYDDNEYNQPKDEQKQETQCNDGLDNDGDGWIDLKDPGCPNSDDDSESNLPTTYQCSDGKDNDHDGKKDSFDPDCSSYKDNDESTPEKTTQCNDNQDNDSDTWTDLEDPGCSNGDDDSESNSSSLQCNDGLDNDQDGKIDSNDPDCSSATDDSEGVPPPPPPPDKMQCEDGVDNDGDGLVDLDDFGCSNNSDDDEQGRWNFKKPKKLIHFQLVGGSGNSKGNIASHVWNSSDGWNAVVENHLQTLVDTLGNSRFDIAFWQIGGGWGEYAVWLPGDQSFSSFLFEALTIAKKDISPSITNYSVLRNFVNSHGIKMMTYIGMPRCEPSGSRYVEVPEHCYPENFNFYQEEITDGSFFAVGYDYAAGHIEENSPAIAVNFAILKDKGIEPYVEAVPPRGYGHFLGYSVWADQERWEFTENNPSKFFSESEINSAGGTTLHGVRNPPDGTCSDEDNICIRQWQWEKSIALLKAGKYITVNLNSLKDAGYDISCLADLAEGSVSDCSGLTFYRKYILGYLGKIFNRNLLDLFVLHI